MTGQPVEASDQQRAGVTVAEGSQANYEAGSVGGVGVAGLAVAISSACELPWKLPEFAPASFWAL